MHKKNLVSFHGSLCKNFLLLIFIVFRFKAGNWFMAMFFGHHARECFWLFYWAQECKCSAWLSSLWPLHVSASYHRLIEVHWWPAQWFCLFCLEHRPVMCLQGFTRALVVSNGRATCCWHRSSVLVLSLDYSLSWTSFYGTKKALVLFHSQPWSLS